MVIEDLDASHCPRFQESIEFLGRRWTSAIVRPMFAGPVRFTDLLDAVPHLSSRLLTQRLEELCQAGVVVRRSDDGCLRYELTARGRDLRQVFLAVDRWNGRWNAETPEGQER
ncbi:helix-turn-helix domain-containing protein [Aeromicrobium sp.]|uniref:winged helix-turn-helix transcriptional regulator n=1 Tax=Aeromicrobium sp. TaxID=1871063 RepID=UPI0025BE580C|nr:helix-turn-helix domain-containing protein [Aeromicrobium sp.]MCK5891811.1 helix-turn-helix transcriptional regulator [Aeromicrobium sp.]